MRRCAGGDLPRRRFALDSTNTSTRSACLPTLSIDSQTPLNDHPLTHYPPQCQSLPSSSPPQPKHPLPFLPSIHTKGSVFATRTTLLTVCDTIIAVRKRAEGVVVEGGETGSTRGTPPRPAHLWTSDKGVRSSQTRTEDHLDRRFVSRQAADSQLWPCGVDLADHPLFPLPQSPPYLQPATQPCRQHEEVSRATPTS